MHTDIVSHLGDAYNADEMISAMTQHHHTYCHTILLAWVASFSTRCLRRPAARHACVADAPACYFPEDVEG